MSSIKHTNKQGDSKSDVLLCFDTKFKSQVYNKLFESDIHIKRIFNLTSPGNLSSGLRRTASKHHENAGYEFESHSRFFSYQYFPTVFTK